MGETDKEQQSTSGKKGTLTAADLAARVKVDPTFASQYTSGTAISVDDAVKLLEERYGKWGGDWNGEPDMYGTHASVWSRDAYSMIWQALPENMRTQEVLSSIDVRPYLEAMNGQKLYFESALDSRVNATVTADLSAPLATIDTQLRQTLSGGMATDLSPSERGAELNRLLAHQPGVAGIDIRMNDAVRTAGAAGSTWDPTKVIDEQTLFPVAELREMVRTGEVSIAQLEQYERQQIEAGVNGTFPIDVTAPWTKTDYSIDYMGVREAMAYLSTLSEQEVGNLQRKMAAAGYFDRTGLGASYVEGDSMDQVTLEAWKLVLGDAVAANKSVPAVIMDGMQNYRTQIREARMRNLEKVDPRYSATLASDYAMSVVGRGLSTEEQAALNSYLTDLVRKRAGFVAGTGNYGVDGPLPQTPEGFTQSDVQMWVGQQTSAEAALLTSSTRWNR